MNEQTSDLVPTPRTPATDSKAAQNAARDRLLADIVNRFTHHPPAENQLPRYQTLRDHGRVLAEAIAQYTPTSREQALALTHLEQAVMWANAAIARNE